MCTKVPTATKRTLLKNDVKVLGITKLSLLVISIKQLRFLNVSKYYLANTINKNIIFKVPLKIFFDQ